MSPLLSGEPPACSLSHLALPHAPGIPLIRNLLTPSECADLIAKHGPELSSATTSYAERDRCIFDDTRLAALLHARITDCYLFQSVTDEDGCTWTPSGLNTRFRLARYGPGKRKAPMSSALYWPRHILKKIVSVSFQGGFFSRHIDGRRLASLDEQSFMTINMYLSSVPKDHGGATRILSMEKQTTGDETEREIGSIQPVQGLAALFSHDLLHDGEALVQGEKYLLRTDLMFTRDVPFEMDVVFPGLSDAEKGRKALEIAARLEDGHNQTEALVWYKKAYRLCPDP